MSGSLESDELRIQKLLHPQVWLAHLDFHAYLLCCIYTACVISKHYALNSWKLTCFMEFLSHIRQWLVESWEQMSFCCILFALCGVQLRHMSLANCNYLDVNPVLGVTDVFEFFFFLSIICPYTFKFPWISHLCVWLSYGHHIWAASIYAHATKLCRFSTAPKDLWTIPTSVWYLVINHNIMESYINYKCSRSSKFLRISGSD